MIDDDAIPVPSEIADVFKCAPWKVTRNRNFPETQHVNLQEVAEIVDEVDEASRRTILPQRNINGTDSMVSLCAVAKGISSSHPLNGHLRRFTARSVAGHKALSNTKVGTLDNVGDNRYETLYQRPTGSSRCSSMSVRQSAFGPVSRASCARVEGFQRSVRRMLPVVADRP